MQRRKEFDKTRAFVALLVSIAMCWTASAQKPIASVDFDQELAYYRPRIALSGDGSHAIAWEAFRKLQDTEEWQIGIQKFDTEGRSVQNTMYLQDPESCLADGEEGGRGVQNADIHFSTDGQLIIAMEPVVDIYGEGMLRKRPRTIISRIDRTGHITSFGAGLPCKTSALKFPFYLESERPQLDILPGTDQIIASVSFEEELVSGPGEKPVSPGLGDRLEPSLRMVSSESASPKYYDAWYDVATNGSLSAYSWQRCPVINELGDSDECDILIEFESHGNNPRLPRKTQPIKVNTGDESGVLNYKPSVAMNSYGHSVVVWIDYRFNEQGDILAQRFDTTGWPVGDNIRVSSGIGGVDDLDGIGPEVAILNNGSFMVVWTQKVGNRVQAAGRLFRSDGSPQAKSFPLHNDYSVETEQADVTSNGSNFAYTWIAREERGNTVYYHIPGSGMTVRSEESPGETDFSLAGYPNPFSEKTTLKYELAREGHVSLSIYDLLGREVKSLIDKWQSPGSYLVNVSAEDLATGYYVIKLQQGDQQFSKVLIRSR